MAATRSFARVNDNAYVLLASEWPTEIKLVATNTCRILLQKDVFGVFVTRKIELGFFVTRMDMADQKKLTRYIVNYSAHRFTKWLELVLEQYLNYLPEFTSEWLNNTTFANGLLQKYGMRIIAVINNLNGDDSKLSSDDDYPIKFIICKE